MKDEINKIQATLEKVRDSQVETQTTLAVNTALLDTHIKRTELLEGRVDKAEVHIIGAVQSRRALTYILGIAATLAGLAVAISRLYP